MNLVERVKNFTAKKLVAPAMIIGAGILGLQAQEQNQKENYDIDAFVPLASFTLDHDNDGFEDTYIITKNPYEQEANIHKIPNLNGELAKTTIKQDYNIPMQNNTGVTAFTYDDDKDGFKDIYIITKNPYEQEANIHKIPNLNGELAKTTIKQDYNIPLGSPNK